MSLFICKSCGKVENSNLAKNKIDVIDLKCCECDTGKHHNEFNKRYPTDLEKEYATYSKYNYITKFDHPLDIDTLEIIIDKGRYDYFKERIFKLKSEAEYMGINNCRILYDSDMDEVYDINNIRNNYSKKMNGIMPYISHMADMYIDRTLKKKNIQSEEEKEYMLSKACLKRLKKKRKKIVVSKVEVDLNIIDKEISNLENKIKELKC